MERTFDEVVFLHRNRLAGLPVVGAVFWTRWEWERDDLIWPLAVILCLGGVAIRSWALQHCGYSRGVTKTLATSGPYRYVRNPLYVGNLLVIAALTVASGLIWLLPVTIGWALLVYGVSIRHEERRLHERYRERFVEYCERVPRWLPGLRPEPQVLALVTHQSRALLLFLPFVLKELNAFGLGG